MPPIYYRVGPSIWLEPWDDDTRHVAFYVLTCEHRITEGLYRLPLEYAVADLGWPLKRFRRAFNELVSHGFVAYDERTSVVLIIKALEWQAPENPNQTKAAIKKLKKVPSSPLFDRFAELAREHSERLHEALREAFPERFAEPFTQPSSEQSGEGIGDPPAPTPSPAQDPPSPPEGGRKRDQEKYEENVEAWAAQHFPERDVHEVTMAIGMLRMGRPPRHANVDSVTEWLADRDARQAAAEEIAA